MRLHPDFLHVVEALQPSLDRLISQAPVKPLSLNRQATLKAIYLLSEGNYHFYVGRTNRLRERMTSHCAPSATYERAALAFRMARKATGQIKATYKVTGSRKDLMLQPEFAAAFTAAKSRIREMDLRYIEEDNPQRQAVLEIYAAVALRTPFNDFDNH